VTLEREEQKKTVLLKLQQEYYRTENERPAEKHSSVWKVEKQLADLRNINLKIDLLEMETEQKKVRKIFKFGD